jgi:gamma-glutamyltranspeptidase/glutathione hydrolase
LVRDRGTLDLRELLEPAISYARHGFVCLPKISSAIADVGDLFREHWPTSHELWLPDGSAPAPGSMMRNPVLADTFERILSEAGEGHREKQLNAALDAFYRGFVAEIIADHVSSQPAMDSSGRAHTGFLAADDFATWQPTYEEPVSLDYADHTVLKPGAWSQGPVFLQQLALLKGWDLGDLDPVSADFVHLVTECAKLAFADREAHYGDPEFTAIELDALLDEQYNAERRALVTAEADTSSTLRPGAPRGRSGFIPSRPESGESPVPGLGEPTFGEVRGDTCHVSVVDRWGNVVAATPSGGWLQSSPAIPPLGFALGTRAQMLWLDADHPNSLAPGKRPRTTLSPSMALKDGRPYLGFGTPGGDTQDQCSLIFFLRHVHHGLNLQEAIEAPTFVTDHFPSSFFPRTANPGGLTLENRFGEDVVENLRSRGHRVELADPWSIGRLCAVSRTPDGVIRAGANPRGAQTYAVGR